MTNKSSRLKDLPVKLIGIPLTGLFVTVLYNLLNPGGRIAWIWPDYFFFTIVSFTLWTGNVSIHYLLRGQLNRIKGAYIRLPIRFGINILFTWSLTWILLFGWNKFIHNRIYDNAILNSLQVIITVISLQISAIYEIVYLTKARESDLLRIERSEKTRILAQLEALKDQLDPHFIFNSLNTLSYLIKQNKQSAGLFNDTLAKVYRYILLNKEKDLVMLKEEIEFASNYFYLLKIRYQKGLNMRIQIDDIESENYLLPPLSLQMLIENAIKHNHFLEQLPLTVEINVYQDQVVVTNNRNEKRFQMQTSRIGLTNLDKRYRIITNNKIEVSHTSDYFKVQLPILKS